MDEARANSATAGEQGRERAGSPQQRAGARDCCQKKGVRPVAASSCPALRARWVAWRGRAYPHRLLRGVQRVLLTCEKKDASGRSQKVPSL